MANPSHQTILKTKKKTSSNKEGQSFTDRLGETRIAWPRACGKVQIDAPRAFTRRITPRKQEGGCEVWLDQQIGCMSSTPVAIRSPDGISNEEKQRASCGFMPDESR